MIAYKLLRVRKNGTIGPLFINRKQVIPIGEWLDAEDHKTDGYAHRPGWHCTAKKSAPHLSKKGRKWYKVMIEDYVKYERPKFQGGFWYLANRMKIMED